MAISTTCRNENVCIFFPSFFVLHLLPSEYKDRAELVAHRMRGMHRQPTEGFEHAARRARIEVGHFMHERDPLIDFVAQAVLGLSRSSRWQLLLAAPGFQHISNSLDHCARLKEMNFMP